MKKKFTLLTTLILSSIALLSCSTNTDSSLSSSNEVSNKYEFEFADMKDTTTKAEMYYSDEYFLNMDADKYNAHLSTASLSLAMTAFESAEATATGDYSNPYYHAKDLLEELGYDKFSVNDDYLIKPGTDTIACLFSEKYIEDENATIIASAIRGQGYESEWASNVTVGLERNEAKGFYDSATKYLSALSSYISDNYISGRIILWTVGFSRSAAVNNLAISRIDRAINNNKNYFGKDIRFAKEDIYSYCFECPMGANFDEEINPRSEIYNNIHNIINPLDPVPMLIMKSFNFTRYGVDHYLISTYNDSNYDSDLEKVKEKYLELGGDSETFLDDFTPAGMFGSESISSFLTKDTSKVNWTSGIYLEDVINNLSKEIETRENYVNNMEPGLREFFSLMLTNNLDIQELGIELISTIISGGKLGELIKDILIFQSDLLPLLNECLVTSLNALGEEDDAQSIASALSGFLTYACEAIFDNLYASLSLLVSKNISCFTLAHYPEITLSYLMLEDSYFTNSPITHDDSGEYTYIETEYSSSGSILIYDESNNLVAKVTGSNVEEVSTYSYGIDNGKFKAYLPKGKYTVVSSEKLVYGALSSPNYSSYLDKSSLVSFENKIYTYLVDTTK